MLIITNKTGEKLTIKPQKVLERVKWQFSRNKKLTEWFNTLLSKKRKSINDILYGSTTVQIGIYKRGSCFFSAQGQTRWDGVFRGKWAGQANKTIGIGKCLFEAELFKFDKTDEQEAAELIIHELAHWVEAYALGKIWPLRPKDKITWYDTGAYVVDVFVHW